MAIHRSIAQGRGPGLEAKIALASDLLWRPHADRKLHHVESPDVYGGNGTAIPITGTLILTLETI